MVSLDISTFIPTIIPDLRPTILAKLAGMVTAKLLPVLNTF